MLVFMHPTQCLFPFITKNCLFVHMKKLIFNTFVFWFMAIIGFGQSTTTKYPDQPDADGRVIKGKPGSWAFKPYMATADLTDYHHASPEAVEAFKDLKYGIRIHWGIYSFFQGESWILKSRSPGSSGAAYDKGPQHSSFAGYYHNIYKSWYPSGFDPKEWASIFKSNGFKFFVFTTKHHDGFSMYNTALKVKNTWDFIGQNAGDVIPANIHYSIMETPFKRDVTKELVEACRNLGLKIGLYYSHPDWFDADFKYDDNHPFYSKNTTPKDDPQAWKRFKTRHAGQLKELLTNYGKIDMLSLDMLFNASTWSYMEDLMRELRPIQPQTMYRWRGIGNYGDYHTPESYIPGEEDMGTMPWQVIHPLSDRKNFSYEPDLDRLHDGPWVVENLVDIVAKGGNFMVGVGPDNTGKFHPKVLEILGYAGKWLEVNGEAIFETRPWQVYKEGENIRFTSAKDKEYLYIHLLQWPGNTISSKLVSPLKGSEIRMLGVKEPLSWYRKKGELVVNIPTYLQEEKNRPCQQIYVIKVKLK